MILLSTLIQSLICNYQVKPSTENLLFHSQDVKPAHIDVQYIYSFKTRLKMVSIVSKLHFLIAINDYIKSQKRMNSISVWWTNKQYLLIHIPKCTYLIFKDTDGLSIWSSSLDAPISSWNSWVQFLALPPDSIFLHSLEGSSEYSSSCISVTHYERCELTQLLASALVGLVQVSGEWTSKWDVHR